MSIRVPEDRKSALTVRRIGREYLTGSAQALPTIERLIEHFRREPTCPERDYVTIQVLTKLKTELKRSSHDAGNRSVRSPYPFPDSSRFGSRD